MTSAVAPAMQSHGPRRPKEPVTEVQWRRLTERAYKCIRGSELLSREAFNADLSWALSRDYVDEVHDARLFLQRAEQRGYVVSQADAAQLDSAFARWSRLTGASGRRNDRTFWAHAVRHLKMISPWWRRRYSTVRRASFDTRERERNPVSDGDLLETIARLRWPNGLQCPRCRSGSIGQMATRAMWSCRHCRYQFHALTGTVLHRTRLPVSAGLAALCTAAAYRNVPQRLTLDKISGLGIKRTAARRLREVLIRALNDAESRDELLRFAEAFQEYNGRAVLK